MLKNLIWKWAELEEIFCWRRYADDSNAHGADTHMENVQKCTFRPPGDITAHLPEWQKQEW